MYMRLPVSCSSASETEATSTRRKSAIKASSDSEAFAPAPACARRSLAPHKIAHKTPMDTSDAATVCDFTKPRNLFISSSRMYTCARTLTPFFVGWKTNLFIAKGNNENRNDSGPDNPVGVRDYANGRHCGTTGLQPGTESNQPVLCSRTSFQRRHHRRQHSLHRWPGGE